jgi:hypothetical protein
MQPIARATVAATFAAGCALDDSSRSTDDDLTVRTCNGQVELCARSLSDVSFAGTHNSFAARGLVSGLVANQRVDIAVQLQAGIRALMLDTYLHRGIPSLCHGNCTFGGSLAVVPELRKLGEFLTIQPNNVLLLLIEEHSLTPAQFEAAMESAGLRDRAYVHPTPGARWPTLGQLVDARTNLVVFTEKDPASRPAGERIPNFYHYLWSHAWETRYRFGSTADFSCTKNRGTSQSNALYLVNHFITLAGPSENASRQANAWPVISDRTADCAKLARPNIVAVDFFDVADEPGPGGIATVLASVGALNTGVLAKK